MMKDKSNLRLYSKASNNGRILIIAIIVIALVILGMTIYLSVIKKDTTEAGPETTPPAQPPLKENISKPVDSLVQDAIITDSDGKIVSNMAGRLKLVEEELSRCNDEERRELEAISERNPGKCAQPDGRCEALATIVKAIENNEQLDCASMPSRFSVACNAFTTGDPSYCNSINDGADACREMALNLKRGIAQKSSSICIFEDPGTNSFCVAATAKEVRLSGACYDEYYMSLANIKKDGTYCEKIVDKEKAEICKISREKDVECYTSACLANQSVAG